MRREHLVKPNTVTANYLRIGSMGLGAVHRQSSRRFGLEEQVFRMGSEQSQAAVTAKASAFACSSYICGAGLPIYWNNMPQSGVQLRLDRQGGVCVMCGSTDIGQGSDSILAYIVAEVLGIDPFDIRVVTADTDLTPVDLGSYSSRVTLMTGNAAIQAAERARELLAMAVAEKLGRADRESFRLRSAARSMLRIRRSAFRSPKRCVLAESKFGTIGTVGSYSPPRSPGKYKGAGVGPSPAYSYSAAVAEVDVDPDTGIVIVERVWIAHDIGKSINPDAGDGPGRRQRLHGAGRSVDGRDGLSRQSQRRAQVSVDARIQESDHDGDVRR